MSKIYTCEQVSNGHPDKICDQIADAVVTDCLQHDKDSRVAIECLLKNHRLIIAGELTSKHRPDYRRLAEEVLDRIGYEKLGYGMEHYLDISILVSEQSPDIALGVDAPAIRALCSAMPPTRHRSCSLSPLLWQRNFSSF